MPGRPFEQFEFLGAKRRGSSTRACIDTLPAAGALIMLHPAARCVLQTIGKIFVIGSHLHPTAIQCGNRHFVTLAPRLPV
jgi:hypothetical protein